MKAAPSLALPRFAGEGTFLVTLVVSALTLGTAIPLGGAAESAAAVTVTFEDTDVGQLPKGFATALTGSGGPVSWRVEEDPTAPAGPRVLVQRSAEKTNGCFPVAVYETISTADLTLTVDFKPVSGTVDQAAGLVWRYQDADNYYLVRANALEGNVVPYRVQAGKRSDLKPMGSGFLAYGTKVEVPSGKWSTLRLEARGKRFSVSLNGQRLFDVEDETFTAAGKIGLWTKADSVTEFDRLTIEPLDGGSR
jgi:hypothetical protein